MVCASGAVQSGCPAGMTCWLVASHQQFSHCLCVLGSVWQFERLREKQWQHLMVWSEMKRFCSQLQRLSLKKCAAYGKYSTDWLQGFFQITILLFLKQYLVFEDKKQFDRSVILSHHISGVICTMLPLCRILSAFVTLVSLWPSSAVEVF